MLHEHSRLWNTTRVSLVSLLSVGPMLLCAHVGCDVSSLCVVALAWRGMAGVEPQILHHSHCPVCSSVPVSTHCSEPSWLQRQNDDPFLGHTLLVLFPVRRCASAHLLRVQCAAVAGTVYNCCSEHGGGDSNCAPDAPQPVGSVCFVLCRSPITSLSSLLCAF